jgi:hypothetical protein
MRYNSINTARSLLFVDTGRRRVNVCRPRMLYNGVTTLQSTGPRELLQI